MRRSVPLIQFRTGDTFHGVLFSAFGAFWIVL
jgi:succinate-acetate transporter protein